MNKKQTSVLLLLLFFVFYSVSPVAYAAHEEQEGVAGYAAQTSNSPANSIHILLLSFFLQHFAAKQDVDNQSDTSFLLKKTKAVLKYVFDIGKDPSGFAILPPDLNLGSPLFFIKHVLQSSSKPHDNSLSFFSGLSPPLVIQLLK